MKRTISAQLFEEAKNLFPGGVHSPVRAFKSVSGPPLFIERGEGCHLYDVDGNRFIDFCNSWGPLVLGHKNPKVIERVHAAVDQGLTFGTPNPTTNKLGKIILENHRFFDKIRFVSSGTEAVMSAIRLARGYTGKNKIIKFEGCYHGHADSLLVEAGSGLATLGTSTSAGIPEAFIGETIVLSLDDKEQLQEAVEQHKDDLAAIIIEPIPANSGLLIQDKEFLTFMRKLCDEHDILLIWDEVISGFRIGFEGAAGYYDIRPDIMTYGKIIGGGMPVGGYAASNEIMSKVAPEGDVYQAGTLSANPISMAAGLATLEVCLEEGFYDEMEEKTQYFVNELNQWLESQDLPVHIATIGSIFWISFSKERVSRSSDIDPAGMEQYKKLHASLLEQGIYTGPSGYEVGFVSAAHTRDDLDKALEAYKGGFKKVYGL